MSPIRRITIPGKIEIECEESGTESGESGSGDRPFVLVHGFTGSRDDWREHMTPLSQHGRTLAPDQRGHGGSSNPGSAAGYTLDQLCDDLSAMLGLLDADPCDLLGHSMGGMVALRYALAHPERVVSLVLMDTAAGELDSSEPARKVIEGVGAHARAAGMAGVVEIMRQAVESGTGFGAASVSAADAFDTSFDRVRRKLEQMDPEAFATLGKALFEQESLVHRLGEIRCPTTVLVGEADQPFRKAAEVMADAIDAARLVVIPESGHQPQLENPAVWRDAVEQHLRRARGGD